MNLDILGNFIHHCWQNRLDDLLRQEIDRRGFGGISLGLCQDLRVRENRIEANGRGHIRPTCGLFVLFVSQADISQNWIVNNGPFEPDAVIDQIAGRRGAIVIRMAVSLSAVETPAPEGQTPVGGAASPGLPLFYRQRMNRQAARLNDNLIEQPVGRALTMLALGPVAVLGNQLYTDSAAQDLVGLLAGVSLVYNLGGVRLGAGQDLSQANLMYNDNQAALGYGPGCLTAQLLVSAGDLSFCNNQSTIPLGVRTNTFLLASSVRAIGNRLSERVAP
jgi:hypothetical protein